jgi:hypothetical protein
MSSQVERDEPVASFEASRPKAAPLKKGATLTLGSKKKDSMTMQALREEGELAPAASCVHSPPPRAPPCPNLSTTFKHHYRNYFTSNTHPPFLTYPSPALLFSTPHPSLLPPLSLAPTGGRHVISSASSSQIL